MKKVTLLLGFFIGIHCNAAYSQTIEEFKKKVVGIEWRLLRFEVGSQMYNVPEEDQNTRLIFKDDGTLLRFQPPARSLEQAEQIKWTINKDFITTQEKNKKVFYKYMVDDSILLRLYLEEIDGEIPHKKVFLPVRN